MPTSSRGDPEENEGKSLETTPPANVVKKSCLKNKQFRPLLHIFASMPLQNAPCGRHAPQKRHRRCAKSP
jgi:hypothetical protein